MEKFTKEKDEILIDLVRCNNVLYDTSDKHYKDNIYKHRVWEHISETLDIPITDIKKRWKHLRDHYNKKKKADTFTGQARSHNNWEYMSQLTFLSQVPSQCNTFTNVAASNETINQMTDDTQEIEDQITDISVQIIDEVSLEQDIIKKGTSEASRVKKRKSNHSSLITILEKSLDEKTALYDRLLRQKTKTPLNKFFDSMAEIVSQFPPHLAAEARLKVCQVVTEIELKLTTDLLYNTSNPIKSEIDII